MKKVTIMVVAALMLMATTGCGTSGTTSGTGSVLGDVLGSVLNGGAAGNVLASIIGGLGTTITKQNMVGTWRYGGPGCAFTSEQLLAKAGGEVAAAEIKQKMLPTYNSLGFTSANTWVTFNEDGTYSASLNGKQMSGQWTLDEKTYKVTMKGLLLSINCYAKRNSNGIALLFEASKLLTLMQTLSALSGNSTAQVIGDLSKNYDGLRLGFDFK